MWNFPTQEIKKLISARSDNTVPLWRRAFIIFCLWLLFAIGCWLSPFIALFYPFKKEGAYTRNVAETADKLVGAVYFGFTGDFTMSVEFAASPERYKRMYRMLQEASPKHCELSLYRIQPYCRISDHKLGGK